MDSNLSHNDNWPHKVVNLRKINGGRSQKAIAFEPKTKRDYENQLLHTFISVYAEQKYNIKKTVYKVISTDDDPLQVHDFKVDLIGKEVLNVEITRLVESSRTGLAHKLQDEALNLCDQYDIPFFAYLPEHTPVKSLSVLFEEASKKPPKEIPEVNDKEFDQLMEDLLVKAKPIVHKSNGKYTIIQTGGRKTRILPLREVVAKAIHTKEEKTYPGINQGSMILLLDDRTLGHTREYIKSQQPLLSYEHASSQFKEIFIISRIASKPSEQPKGGSRSFEKTEFVFTPLKAAWHKGVFINRVSVVSDLIDGKTLPMQY